jgi:hypothetical protein
LLVPRKAVISFRLSCGLPTVNEPRINAARCTVWIVGAVVSVPSAVARAVLGAIEPRWA